MVEVDPAVDSVTVDPVFADKTLVNTVVVDDGIEEKEPDPD